MLLRRALPLLLVLVLAVPTPAGEPAKDLKDADAKVRLAAVDALAGTTTPDAEALLVGALTDRDGEVVERAAAALGKRDSPTAIQALAKLCLDAPARRTRLSAARALAASPRWAEGAQALVKTPMSGIVAACEAMALVGDLHEDESVQALADRADGANAKKQPGAAAAAARCLGAFPPAERTKRLPKAAADPDTAAAAAAVDAIRYKPDDATTPALLEILARAKPPLPDAVERRTRAAFVSAVAAKTAPADAMKVVKLAIDAVAASKSEDALRRLAHLIGDLGGIPDDRVTKAELLTGLAPVLDHGQAKVRCAGAWALARIGTDAAAERATVMARTDADAHVRLIAVQSLAMLRDPVTNESARSLFCDRLTYETDPLVREEAAVALGRKGGRGADTELKAAVTRAMADKKGTEWAVGTCALVSLGKTRDPMVVQFLVTTYGAAKDWKLRGGAIVGLGHVKDRGAVPTLIEALGDKDVQIAQTAFEALRRMTPDKISPKQAEWKAWWEKNAATYTFVDLDEERKKAQKHGYAPDLPGVYEGLDVIVLATRGGGDRIEDILSDLKIEHRITRAGSLPKAGLHPYGLFVANCPGELNPDDVEPIAWFLRTGGYLFNSCWALHETIEKVYPGVLRKYETRGQVIDNVTAKPARLESPFIDGVFRDLVQPIYCLEGAHLIEVMDHERAEVLLDSPWTEAKYGSGNMAAWFRAGHGLVLDSSNHFEEQGLAKAAVKSPEERIAYAADHMGLSWADIRAVDSKAWKTPQDAGKAATDLSCFRLITNFVRQKRKQE